MNPNPAAVPRCAQVPAFAAVVLSFLTITTGDFAAKTAHHSPHPVMTPPLPLVFAVAAGCCGGKFGAAVWQSLSPVQRSVSLCLLGRGAFLLAATVANFALLAVVLWKPVSSWQAAFFLLTTVVGAYLLSAAWAELLERGLAVGQGDNRL